MGIIMFVMEDLVDCRIATPSTNRFHNYETLLPSLKMLRRVDGKISELAISAGLDEAE